MFHKEGYKIIFIALVSFIAALLLADKFIHLAWLKMTVQLLVLFFFVMILQFFRNPNRKINPNKNTILAPVDGKVVVILNAPPGSGKDTLAGDDDWCQRVGNLLLREWQKANGTDAPCHAWKEEFKRALVLMAYNTILHTKGADVATEFLEIGRAHV